MASSYSQVPATPYVISPSPTPSEHSARDYFASSKATANGRLSSAEPIVEEDAALDDPELSRARPRSRSPQLQKKLSKRVLALDSTSAPYATSKPVRRKPDSIAISQPDDEPQLNGHLSPASAVQGLGREYWRALSRSRSPLGLIPIHREWREFIHKHEIPRKALHVSIGFFTIYFYLIGTQSSSIHPILLAALVPIFTIDFVRMRWPAMNRLYIRLLGAFMRESEAHDKYNGVISYLAGAWAVTRFCQKDIAILAILLLSWCDTAASTFGRMWGKYTPRVRKGKSLAGSLAAFAVGVLAALLFWDSIAPMVPQAWNMGENEFAYSGFLRLRPQLRHVLGWTREESTLDGYPALAIVALYSGLVASVSEAIDLWGLDDNLTIPVLSGIGLGAFFWAFGNHT